MSYEKAKEAFERYFVLECLNRHKWEKAVTAKALGITRQGLFKIINKYGLKRSDKIPAASSFLPSDMPRSKPVRRVVLFDEDDFSWLRSKGDIASYSRLIKAGLRLLREKSGSDIRKLI